MTRPKTILVMGITVALLAALLIVAWPSTATTVQSSKIRRTILLKFKPEAKPEDVQKILREVKANITQMKGVRNVFVGRQIIDRIPFAYGISMDFDSEASLKMYRQDEEHRRTHNDYSKLVEQAQISDIRDE